MQHGDGYVVLDNGDIRYDKAGREHYGELFKQSKYYLNINDIAQVDEHYMGLFDSFLCKIERNDHDSARCIRNLKIAIFDALEMSQKLRKSGHASLGESLEDEIRHAAEAMKELCHREPTKD